MGKGRSVKPAVQQYLEDIEWQNQRRSSPKGYFGKWFDPVLWKRRFSWQELSLSRGIIIGGILVFIYGFATNYEPYMFPFVALIVFVGIIIFFAIRDGIKK